MSGVQAENVTRRRLVTDSGRGLERSHPSLERLVCFESGYPQFRAGSAIDNRFSLPFDVGDANAKSHSRVSTADDGRTFPVAGFATLGRQCHQFIGRKEAMLCNALDDVDLPFP